MRNQLGVRCPECGTTDAPCISVVVGSDSVTNNADCPRCGRSRTGVNAYSALRAFYGPQEAALAEPLPVCGVTPALGCDDENAYYYYAEGPRVAVMGPICATPELALAAWDRLVGGGR